MAYDEYLYGEWRSNDLPAIHYQVYELEHIINHEWWGGYSRRNILHRKVFSADNHQIADEFICSNQAVMMYEPLLGP